MWKRQKNSFLISNVKPFWVDEKEEKKKKGMNREREKGGEGGVNGKGIKCDR